MTLSYRVWLELQKQPSSVARVAALFGLPYDKVENAFRSMRHRKRIAMVCRDGRDSIYRVTGEPMMAEGRGRQPGSRENLKLGPASMPKVRRVTTDNERREDAPIAHGYGSGKCELERVWR